MFWNANEELCRLGFRVTLLKRLNDVALKDNYFPLSRLYCNPCLQAEVHFEKILTINR